MVEKCNEVFLILVVGAFPDQWQAILQGVVKALGIQAKCSIINLVAYWAVFFPLSIVMAFHLDFGFKGIWLSCLTAQVFMGIAFQVVVIFVDWQYSADKC